MKALLWIAILALWAASEADAASATRTALDTLVTRAREAHSDSMLVLRDGKVLAQYYRSGSPGEPIELMSATKSVVALAVGLLLKDGKLASLDTPVCTFYPEWKQGRKARITVRMLMNQTSGLQNVPNTGVEIYPAPDAVQLALTAELESEPGTKFSYNNKATNLLAALVDVLIGKLKTLSGKSFDSQAALLKELNRVLGSDSFDELRTQLQGHGSGLGKVFHAQSGPIVGFDANGYLGQYIVVVPDARIIAIRQIAQSDDWQAADGYDDFIDRVIALAATFTRAR